MINNPYNHNYSEAKILKLWHKSKTIYTELFKPFLWDERLYVCYRTLTPNYTDILDKARGSSGKVWSTDQPEGMSNREK